MDFEWDPRKAAINLKKHGVRFADAVTVFDDPHTITILDDESDPDEDRFITLGMDSAGRILVVVHTPRPPKTRIISARKADKLEQEEYGGSR